MARLLRLWEKKRGHRRTGSNRAGKVGEATFFVALLVLGTLMLFQSWQEQGQIASPGKSIPGLTLGVMCLLLAIGAIGLVYSILQMRISGERRAALAQQASHLPLLTSNESRTNSYPQVPSDADLTNSPGIRLAYSLPVGGSPAWQLGGAAGFFLIWSTFTVTLATATALRLDTSAPPWPLLFVLVGSIWVGCWSVVYLWRELRWYTGIGPTTLEISAHPLYPGREYALFASQAGRLQLTSFRVRLICQESATYRQGTDTRTSTQLVYQQEIINQEDIEVQIGIPFEQDCEFQVPSRIMHSFKGTHNSVQWKIQVDVQTKEWPAFRRTFPLVVYPPTASSSEAS